MRICVIAGPHYLTWVSFLTYHRTVSRLSFSSVIPTSCMHVAILRRCIPALFITQNSRSPTIPLFPMCILNHEEPEHIWRFAGKYEPQVLEALSDAGYPNPTKTQKLNGLFYCLGGSNGDIVLLYMCPKVCVDGGWGNDDFCRDDSARNFLKQGPGGRYMGPQVGRCWTMGKYLCLSTLWWTVYLVKDE